MKADRVETSEAYDILGRSQNLDIISQDVGLEMVKFRRLTLFIWMALGTDPAASRISSAPPLIAKATTLLIPSRRERNSGIKIRNTSNGFRLMFLKP